MALESLFPNGDSSIQWANPGGTHWTELDQGRDTPDDTKTVDTSTKANIDIYDLTDSAITDADTVNTVTIKVRVRMDSGSAGDNRINFSFLIGGISQATQTVFLANDGVYVDSDLNVANWNQDWTASELDGAQVAVNSVQGAGMPTSATWRVSEVEVVVDYTPAAGGVKIVSLGGIYQTTKVVLAG